MLTVAEALAAVDNAAREILSVDELANMRLRVEVTSVNASRSPSSMVPSGQQVIVVVFDDEARLWLNPEETVPELFVRARSDLQDFVAESRFGWGQRRD